MTTALDNGSPTIVDVAKAYGPDGKILHHVQRLSQNNALLQTMAWKEGNRDTGHEVASDSALPSVTWTRFNEGVAYSKGTTDTYTETTGMLKSLSSVDCDLAEINGGTDAYRAMKDSTHLTAMSNALEGALWYESTQAHPERILGALPRLGATTSKYGNQLLKADANASGANQSSIVLVGWDKNTVYGISPRGTGTGLKMEDMGKVRVQDQSTTTANSALYKWETLFTWKCGFCVEDYRYIVRIANIDIARLDGNPISTFTSDLITMIVKAKYQLPTNPSARFCWYMSRKVAAYLRIQAIAKVAGSTLSMEPAPMVGSPGVFGAPILHAEGYPCYVSDGLSNAEAVVA